MIDHKEELELINRIRTTFLSKKMKKLSLLLSSIPKTMKTVIDLLIRKSLIKPDRYNYPVERVEGKLKLPPNRSISQSQTEEFHRRLKTIMDIYTEHSIALKSIEQLTEQLLEELRELLECVNFSHLSHSDPNTHLFKTLLEQAIQHSPEKEKDLTTLNQQLLANSHGEFLQLLEELSRFMDDFYKLQLRFAVLVYLDEKQFNLHLFESEPHNYREQLQEEMQFNYPRIPYLELYIQRAVYDFYIVDREEALERFKELYLTEEDSKAVSFPPEFELQLLIKRSSTLVKPFNQLINLLVANYEAYFKSKNSLLKRIVYLLSKILGLPIKESDELIIYYFEPSAKKHIHEKISFRHFSALFYEKVNALKALKDPKSKLCSSLRNLSLPRLQSYFQNYYLELFSINEKLSGLENEFITVLKGSTIGKKKIEELKGSIDRSLAQMKERHDELQKKMKAGTSKGAG